MQRVWSKVGGLLDAFGFAFELVGNAVHLGAVVAELVLPCQLLRLLLVQHLVSPLVVEQSLNHLMVNVIQLVQGIKYLSEPCLFGLHFVH